MISRQEMITKIDANGGRSPFVLRFVKADGSIREMVALKKNKQKDRLGMAAPKSKFKYNLSENDTLLLWEIPVQTETKEVPGVGTVHQLPAHLNLNKVPVNGPKAHKSVRIHTIIGFNGKEVYS